jgi:hypothetical protein
MSDYPNPERNSPYDPNPQRPAANSNPLWVWGGVFLVLAFIFVMFMMADGQLRFASNTGPSPTTTSEPASRQAEPPAPASRPANPPAAPTAPTPNR